MLEFPQPSAGFRFQLDPVTVREFRIGATGPGVMLFEANAGRAPVDPDAVTPDPVIFLSGRIADGFFPPAEIRGSAPALEIAESELFPAEMHQVWSLVAQNLPAGVFRILANMLVARQMEQVEFDAPSAAGPGPAPMSLPYPPIPGKPDFAIDYQMPAVAHRERSLEISFRQEPDDATLDMVFGMLDDWIRLVLLGAYPRAGQSPLESGLIPDLAILSGPTTVYQGIDEAFACDEAAFAPILSYFYLGKGRETGVSRITIR